MRTPPGTVITSLIEAEFAKAPACGHCGSEAFSKWGVATGMKRYMCKACARTFNALTGTPLADLQKREKWLEYAHAIVNGLSLRKTAKCVGVHLETSFRWRHRFLTTSKGAKAAAVTGTSSSNRQRAPSGLLAERRENAAAGPKRNACQPTSTIAS